MLVIIQFLMFATVSIESMSIEFSKTTVEKCFSDMSEQ